MDMSVVHGSVVVGVDGSAASAAALAWAVGLAETECRRVTVVHACGLPGALADFEDVVANERGLMSVGESIAREAVRNVQRAVPTVAGSSRPGSGLAVRSLVVMGHPEAVLLEASESAELLVVGARGRGAVAATLLGSVSGRVARESACPVVVVRDLDEKAEQGRHPVVVGVDGTAVSSAAVEFAFRMASESASPLVVLHATWDARERASSVIDLRSFREKVNLSEAEERLVAETVAGLCEKYPDVAVTETYRRGEPVRALVEASRTAWLVVVGTRGRRLLATTLLGSVSRGVAERAFCPVAVVRP